MHSVWLSRALEESRARGFLGPNSIEPHVTHAEGFISVWDGVSNVPPQAVLDLGSGGGLPGLVLAESWGCEMTLLDSMEKRTAFLRETLEWEGAPMGVSVVTARAEDAARDKTLENHFNLVVSRSFGPPAVTAECAVRFLVVGGVLIVSEPPESDGSRWRESQLKMLGLRKAGLVHASGSGYQILEKVSPTPADYPRPVGVPGKKPLF